jgi:TPP-dependent pyruvate/acetoin dehydrogenase alpha subunit
MGGHATHDEREARAIFPAELFAHWGARDPIGLYEAWLVAEGHAEAGELAAVEADVVAEVEAGAREALASRDTHPADAERVAEGVYKMPRRA